MPTLEEAMQLVDKKCPGRPCSVNEARKRMDAKDQELLDAMLAEGSGHTNSQIHDTLQLAGHAVGRQTVGQHRRKACRCFNWGN